MNSPVMQGLNLNTSAVCEECQADRLGGRHGRPVQAGQHPLVRRQRRGIRPPVPAAGRRRHASSKLDPRKRPNSYLAWSDPSDVARVEDRTFICSQQQGRRRPDQQLDGPGRDARHAAAALRRLHARPHDVRGAVLHGPAGLAHRPHRRRALRQPLRRRQHEDHDAHGQGRVRRAGRRRRIRALRAHRGRAAGAGPEATWRGRATRPSTSSTTPRPARSGPTAPATAATRCWARSASRCASPPTMGRDQGWLAEHMLILGVTTPEGKKYHVAAAFPQRLRQDQLRDADPAQGLRGLEGHHHRRRHRLDQAATRTAGSTPSIRKPATSAWRRARITRPIPNCMATLERDVIFTNVALTDDGDVWWEGMGPRPAHAHRLAGQGLDAADRQARPAPRRPTRTRASRSRPPNNPALDPAWDDPNGVPIDAFIFGGRRSTTVPLVTEARNWGDGVYMAATMGSETTAAVVGQLGVVRRDPFAMLPFTGYNMCDYFQHWLDIGHKLEKSGARLPRIYSVNWFRKGADGKFVWPGYGENMRVLKWMIDRIEGRAGGSETRIRRQPALRGPELDRPGLQRRAVQDGDQHRQGRLGEGAAAAHRAVPAAQVPPARQSWKRPGAGSSASWRPERLSGVCRAAGSPGRG